MSRPFVSFEKLVYRFGGVDHPGECRVEVCTAEGERPVRARVSFAGSGLEPVEATGEDPLAAVTAALHLGTETLQTFCAAGGEILHHVQGWGLEPAETDLFERCRGHLELQLGLPERPYLGRIVSGPTPDEWGDGVFVIEYESQKISVCSSVMGAGPRQSFTDESANIGLRLVFRYMKEHPDEMREVWRKAALLRRAAGNDLWPDLSKGDASLVERIEVCPRGVRLHFGPPYADATVFLLKGGCVADEWNDWTAFDDERSEVVRASALAYALAHEDEMTQAGLDMAWYKLVHTLLP